MNLIIFLLAGCTEDYDREDIEKYVKETYQLRDFTVSRKPREVVDEEEYTDYLWTVKLKDGSGITFYVMDNYGWGSEWVTNYLYDNFDDVALEYMYEQYGGSTLLELEKDDEALRNVSLTADFEDRKELQEVFVELGKFSSFTEKHGYGKRL